MALFSFKSACRVCFNVSNNLKLLHQHPTIVEKLNFVGESLQYEDNVEVPQYICNECEGELEFAYKYLLKIRCLELRNSVIADAKRKEHTQLVFKVEDSKLDFKSPNQIFEDLQTNSYRDNDVNEDKLMSPVKSSSVIELNKCLTLVLDDMAKDELKTSAINHIIKPDQHLAE